MTAQIRGTESGMRASRLEANVCYLGLTPKPDPEAADPEAADPEAADPEAAKPKPDPEAGPRSHGCIGA